MNEADQQFAQRLAEDLEPYLGPEIVLDELDLGEPNADHAYLRATCRFDGGTEVIESDGETRLEAYNALIIAAAELRITVAVRHMLDPRRY
jgi:hypothetical protein